jgi:hypothetical protein
MGKVRVLIDTLIGASIFFAGGVTRLVCPPAYHYFHRRWYRLPKESA